MKTISILILILFPSILYAQSGSFITSSDGTKLYVQEFGNGKPVILLAGGPGLNADYLQPIWTKLSITYKCIVLNQRGTGKSILDSVNSNSMSMDNYMSDLETMRKQLNLEKLTLIGHSWGSMLAMEYASRYPEKVEKLVLLNPGGLSSNYIKYFQDNILCRLHEEDIQEISELSKKNKSIMSAIYPGYFYNRSSALEIKKTMDFNEINGQDGVTQLTYNSYFSDQKMRIKNIEKYKGEVSIIAGRQDPMGESTFYEIKEHLPQTQIYFIEKCGHFPWLENQEQKEEFFHLLTEDLKN